MSPAPPSPLACLLLFSGASTGLIVGILVGVFIYGVATFQTPFGRIFAPISELIGCVAIGQVVGTLGALTFFGAAAVFKTQVQGQSLFNAIAGGYDDIYLNIISLGTILLMICGAIAGALTKRDLPQPATLNVE